MFKKLLSLLLAILIISGSFANLAYADTGDTDGEEYRGGFSLSPLDSDETGVNPESKYLLKTKSSMDISAVRKIVTIDSEPAPSVEAAGKDSYYITPAKPFEQNRLYTFRIKPEAGDEVTWTFQTAEPFKILRSLPGNKTNMVPVNSGIEIYFSHEGYEDIEPYFEISPAVKGRFERHKKTAVFVPKGLEPGEIYTVRIKKGLKLKDSLQSIKEDYTFSFETEVERDMLEGISKGFFFYNKALNDYTQRDIAHVPFGYYIADRHKIEKLTVKTDVYTYKDVDSFVNAITKKSLVPSWAVSGYFDKITPGSDVSKVLSFEQELENKNNETAEYIRIPEALAKGFYLLDSCWEDVHFQTFIQVTDTCMYVSKSDNQTLVWLNNLKSKEPISGASVSILGEKAAYTANQDGVAMFDTPQIDDMAAYSDSSLYEKQLIKVVTPDGETSFLNYFPYNYSGYGEYGENNYWQYFSTDRKMYKPNDTVEFWGFIKSRYSEKEMESLTVELQKGYSYYYYRGGYGSYGYDMPLAKQTVSISNGIYRGSFKLPVVEQGGYTVILKSGDKLIASQYLDVQNYVKPAYKIDITRDKQAVFPGEEVNFDIKASFFEGTGVSNLGMDYMINEYDIGSSQSQGAITTDVNGKASIKYKAVPKDNSLQGIRQVSMNANAKLPEIGQISGADSLRVFINDINVDFSTDIKANKGVIKAKVNKITLDKLNNGTAKDDSDYLGDPCAQTELAGTVYKNTWVAVEDGEDYDFINKVTVKRYHYERKTTPVKDFYMITDANGLAEFQFDAPRSDYEYYSAEIRCKDYSGRAMNFSLYIGESYYDYNDSSYDDNTYNLDGGKDSYKLGEEVKLTFKKGRQPLKNGSFLFIKSQNGIREYTLKKQSEFSFAFDEKYMPNVYVNGVYFDGNTCIDSREFNAVYDYKERELEIEAKPDKESYRPGEEAVIKIKVRDKVGKPHKAFVNASIIDEALLSLWDWEKYTDVPSKLYGNVYSGISFSRSSHADSGVEGVPALFGSGFGSEAKSDAAMAAAAPPGQGNSARQDFKDTAYFETVGTDADGYAEMKFKVPDNITSWRATISAISKDLYVGNGKVNINVSLPIFINYTLNDTYLSGDQPILGLNAYGGGLKEGEGVEFEVTCPQYPVEAVRVNAKAFERINVPLWEMAEGNYDIIVSARSQGGLSDSIKHAVKVINTYHQIDKAVYYDLKPQLKLEGGKSGNTRLVFKDKSRGMFFPELLGLSYSGGNRIDQKLARTVAAELAKKYFEEFDMDAGFAQFKPEEYQGVDGGISLLPYDSSDPELTARLSSILKDKVDKQKLGSYFYNILQQAEVVDGSTLYGLAVLKEPVLLSLEKASKVDNLSIKELIYIALAYCEIGERAKAEGIYDKRLSRYIEERKPFYRVNTGADNDDILEATSLAAILASKLDRPEKKGMYEYCISNWTNDILINAEKLLYIGQEIEKYKGGAVKFTYRYMGEEKSINLGKGQTFVLNIPSQKVPEFEVTGVEGDISAISVFKQEALSLGKLDENISINRKYYTLDGTELAANSLKQGDIIKVELACKAGPKAVDGGYEITDYLPSGLKAVEGNSEYYYRNVGGGYSWWSHYKIVDGQKVRFYIYKRGSDDETQVFSYYARVISPGIYKAEGAVIQGIKSRESINATPSQTLYINWADKEIFNGESGKIIRVKVNGRDLIFDLVPMNRDGRVLVPMRAIFEAMGAEVTWDGAQKAVLAKNGSMKVALQVGSRKAAVNGTDKELDVSPVLINGRVLVPIRFIAESLGAKVDWDGNTRMVSIMPEGN